MRPSRKYSSDQSSDPPIIEAVGQFFPILPKTSHAALTIGRMVKSKNKDLQPFSKTKNNNLQQFLKTKNKHLQFGKMAWAAQKPTKNHPLFTIFCYTFTVFSTCFTSLSSSFTILCSTFTNST